MVGGTAAISLWWEFLTGVQATHLDTNTKTRSVHSVSPQIWTRHVSPQIVENEEEKGHGARSA